MTSVQLITNFGHHCERWCQSAHGGHGRWRSYLNDRPARRLYSGDDDGDDSDDEGDDDDLITTHDDDEHDASDDVDYLFVDDVDVDADGGDDKLR